MEIVPRRDGVTVSQAILEGELHVIRFLQVMEPDLDAAVTVAVLEELPRRLERDESVVRVVIFIVGVIDPLDGASARERLAELRHHRVNADRTDYCEFRSHHRPQPVGECQPQDDPAGFRCVPETESPEHYSLLDSRHHVYRGIHHPLDKHDPVHVGCQEKRLAGDIRCRGGDPRVGLEVPQETVRHLHPAPARGLNPDVGIEPHEHVGDDAVESVEDGKDDREGGNPDGDPRDRHYHDDIDEPELSFRPQVSLCYEPLVAHVRRTGLR